MGISVSVLPDEGPPQLGIDLTDLDPSGSVYSVEWSVNDTDWRPATGAVELEGAGADFVREPFPPLNVEVTYRLVILSGAIPAGPMMATITVESPTAYIQDSRNPRTWVALETEKYEGHILAWGSLVSAAYEQAVDLVQVMGDTRPTASVGQRMIAGEIPLKVDRELLGETSALKTLLMSAGIYVVRGVVSDLLEPVAHVTLTASEKQMNMHMPGAGISTFDLTARQVRSFALRIAIPWWTYDTVKALWEGQSYDSVEGARPGESYAAWRRNPEPS